MCARQERPGWIWLRAQKSRYSHRVAKVKDFTEYDRKFIQLRRETAAFLTQVFDNLSLEGTGIFGLTGFHVRETLGPFRDRLLAARW